MCASSRDRKREVCPDLGAARRPQSADRRKLNFTQQRKAISTRPCRIFRGFQLARRQRLQFPTLERGRCLSNFIDYIPHLRKSVLARLARSRSLVPFILFGCAESQVQIARGCIFRSLSLSMETACVDTDTRYRRDKERSRKRCILKEEREERE